MLLVMTEDFLVRGGNFSDINEMTPVFVVDTENLCVFRDTVGNLISVRGHELRNLRHNRIRGFLHFEMEQLRYASTGVKVDTVFNFSYNIQIGRCIVSNKSGKTQFFDGVYDNRYEHYHINFNDERVLSVDIKRYFYIADTFLTSSEAELAWFYIFRIGELFCLRGGIYLDIYLIATVSIVFDLNLNVLLVDIDKNPFDLKVIRVLKNPDDYWFGYDFKYYNEGLASKLKLLNLPY